MQNHISLALMLAFTFVCSFVSPPPNVWGLPGLPTTGTGPPCTVTQYGKGTFTETSAIYPMQGNCWDGQTNWTWQGQGGYQAGKQFGTAQEGFTFASPQGNGRIRLTMGGCYSDPWIDDGICNRNELRISWEGPGSVDALTRLLSYDPGGPIPPPFSASLLRRDRDHPAQIQAFRTQRQNDLQALAAKRKQEQLERLTGQPPKGAVQGARVIDLMYRPTILSPGEGGQYVVGKPIGLMVKPPEKDILGTVLKITYQNWVCDQSGKCWWNPAGAESPVSVAEAQAGAYRLKSNDLSRRGRWRINVQRVEPAPLGAESPWRNFSVITAAQQTGPTGPTKGPVFGR